MTRRMVHGGPEPRGEIGRHRPLDRTFELMQEAEELLKMATVRY